MTEEDAGAVKVFTKEDKEAAEKAYKELIDKYLDGAKKE